jgi:hypothetical protein
LDRCKNWYTNTNAYTGPNANADAVHVLMQMQMQIWGERKGGEEMLWNERAYARGKLYDRITLVILIAAAVMVAWFCYSIF